VFSFREQGTRRFAAVLKPRLRNAEREAAMNEPEIDHDERQDEKTQEPPRVLNAEEIFAGKREVLIELDGVRYRLRITRRGKLILQK
jgi:hemin uptake protein HemP